VNEKAAVPYAAVRMVVDPARPPRQVHRFLYTRVGAEMVLDVGYHDMAELKEFVDKVRAKTAETPTESAGELPLYVTDRFVLPISAAEDLLRTADFIRKDLERLRALLAAPVDTPEPTE